jgi:hypothetical protein
MKTDVFVLNGAARLYARYAVALLAVTLLAGVYLRAMFTFSGVRPPAMLGLAAPNLVHAHSHAGFFGWAAMGACALIVARLRPGASSLLLHRVLAHAIGIASLAAFVGFARRGYDMVTIPLSALHVLLWAVFAAAVWLPLGALEPGVRRFLRASVAFLVLAGLATVVPVMVMVRGITDPWLNQIAVKLFLTPFVTGFLVLASLGVLADRLRIGRHGTTSLALIAAGALPSTLLYVSAAPPLPWLLVLGRLGIGAVGVGLLLFVVAALRARRDASDDAATPLVLLALGSAFAVAVLKLLALFGVGAALMHSRNLTVAVMHLVLLGVVTPAFMIGMRPTLHATRRTLVFGAGLLVMVSALGLTAWPWAVRQLIALGVPLMGVFHAAFGGGVIAAVALLALFVSRSAARSRNAPAVSHPRAHGSSALPR